MDTLGDMLIRIKNAGTAGHKTVMVPHSKLNLAVAELLAREGYVSSVAKRQRKNHPVIEVSLAYREDGKTSRVRSVNRVSKLSRRVYAGVRDIFPVRQGTGIMVISTPQGVMTGAQAREARLGGEVLCTIW